MSESPQATQPRGRLLWQAVVIVGSALVLLLVARQVSGQDLRRLLAEARADSLVVAALTYLGMQLVRGWRFSVLSRGGIPWLRLSAVAAAQNLLLTVLPLRMGEISFVVLLGRERGLGFATATKVLLLVRLLDLSVVLAMFLAAALAPGVVPPAVRASAPVAALLLAVTLGLVLWPGPVSRLLRAPVTWLTARPGLAERRWIQRLQSGFARVLTIEDEAAVRRQLPLLALQSALVWGLSIVASYAILEGVGARLPVMAVVYVATTIVLASVIPVHGLASYGPLDAVGVACLMSLGLAAGRAAAVQLSWHTLQVLMAGLWGALGWVYLNVSRPRAASPPS